MIYQHKDTWTAWAPLGVISKAGGPPSDRGAGSRRVGRIGGIMSTAARDFQGEEIVQSGIDWRYFLKHGWFNHEHQPGAENILGYPERVIPQGTATRVEGCLYLDDERAARIYAKAQQMAKAGGDRSLGYSVEGRALERDPARPKRILKSIVLNVAITAHPVNPEAKLDVLDAIAKSASALGYMAPAGTAGGEAGGFAPLVAQSLDGHVSRLTASLRAKFPALTEDDAAKIARDLAASWT